MEGHDQRWVQNELVGRYQKLKRRVDEYKPQFIEAAPVVFFEELGIAEPDVNLEVGSGPHGWQTGQMLMRVEKVLLDKKPDWALV